MTLKTCRLCDTEKPLTSEFWHKGSGIGGFHTYCKPCNAKYAKKWCLDNPDRKAATLLKNHLKARYDITPEEYETLLKKQGGVCAICLGKCVTGQRLSVDHDHATGLVRGLLCVQCNGALGMLGDNSEVLERASQYLSVKQSSGPKLSGVFTVDVHNPDGTLADTRISPNIMCTSGYAQLALAMAWNMAFDQNNNLGITLSPTFCAPIYGAVGQASGNVTAADTTLFSELGRNTLYSINTSGSSITLGFFFGTTVSNWNITECGIFLSATSVAGVGFLLDHSILQTPISKTASQTATLSVTFSFS
jgi:hypothetical protein